MAAMRVFVSDPVSNATTVAMLSHEGFVHGDSMDPLPKGFHRFWIAGPADFLQQLARPSAP